MDVERKQWSILSDQLLVPYLTLGLNDVVNDAIMGSNHRGEVSCWLSLCVEGIG